MYIIISNLSFRLQLVLALNDNTDFFSYGIVCVGMSLYEISLVNLRHLFEAGADLRSK